MPLVFKERQLQFSFDDKIWKALKYDESPAHLRVNMNEHKAIDFLAIYKNESIVLMEVKSFKGHRIENKNRISSGELNIEIARKVRDSVAGIVGTGRSKIHINHDICGDVAQKLVNANNDVLVIVWMEEDKIPNGYHRQKHKADASIRLKELKSKLSWLNAKVSVNSISSMPAFYGLKVKWLQVL